MSVMDTETQLRIECLDGNTLEIAYGPGWHYYRSYEMLGTERKFVRAPHHVSTDPTVTLLWEVTRWPDGIWRDGVLFTCEKCKHTDATYYYDIRFDLCGDCRKQITRGEYHSGMVAGRDYCNYNVPYTSCHYTDVNADGYCVGHAKIKCQSCGGQATGGCHTGTFAICGTPTCDRDTCRKKHYKKDHPDGRLA
jgi:hypothetical protein